MIEARGGGGGGGGGILMDDGRGIMQHSANQQRQVAADRQRMLQGLPGGAGASHQGGDQLLGRMNSGGGRHPF